MTCLSRIICGCPSTFYLWLIHPSEIFLSRNVTTIGVLRAHAGSFRIYQRPVVKLRRMRVTQEHDGKRVGINRKCRLEIAHGNALVGTVAKAA
jgi:hypothetical protein